MKKYVMGLDNGGTVIKASIFDLNGNEISGYGQRTKVLTPQSGYAERDMEELWLSNCSCVRGAIEKSGIHPETIIGIAVAGHGKGLYLWGRDQRPACNGIISTDSRAWQYPDKWYREGTAQKLYKKLCQRLIPCQQVSLLAWMKEHDRLTYDHIQWVFSVKDYIRFRLTGEAYSEATDISGSGLMNIADMKFDRNLLMELGIEEVYEKLAPIKYSYEYCGSITPEAAALTGLKAGTPVAGGMFDIDACAVGMDVTSPEQLCTIAGTWSINEYIATEPVLDGSVDMNSVFAIPGYYLVEECSATSAGNLEWFVNRFMNNCPVPAGRNIYDITDELAQSIKPQTSDVYFLPFLYGSFGHPLGKGAFIGLTAFHDLSHMLRAVYEGVAYSHKTHIERLLSSRPIPKTVRMAGGAVNSPFWVQMFADVLEISIETVSVKELGALGAAMAAAIAAGEFTDYREAARAMVHISGIVEPDLERTGIYEEKYRKYTEVRKALEGVWDNFRI